MKLNIPIEETIKKRVCVRTYDSKSLSEKGTMDYPKSFL